MRNLLILFVIVFFSGCYTERKATKDVIKAHVHYPNVSSKVCSDLFPPVQRTAETEKIYYGVPEYIHDTVILITDSIVYKTITTTKTVRDTVVKTDTKTIVNRAREAELELIVEKRDAAISEHEKKIAKQGKALDISLWAIIALGSYTLGRWVLRIWGIKLP
jgi:hypothetical protein